MSLKAATIYKQDNIFISNENKENIKLASHKLANPQKEDIFENQSSKQGFQLPATQMCVVHQDFQQRKTGVFSNTAEFLSKATIKIFLFNA